MMLNLKALLECILLAFATLIALGIYGIIVLVAIIALSFILAIPTDVAAIGLCLVIVITAWIYDAYNRS